MGTGYVANYLRRYRSFKKARAFVRGLGLKSDDEWRRYCKSEKKPDNIPAAPHIVYDKKGWVGLGDWLGTGSTATYRRKYWSFKEARTFVRELGLKSGANWEAYCKSGKKPDDIPNAPRAHYADSGWVGMGDWLGTGKVRGGATAKVST